MQQKHPDPLAVVQRTARQQRKLMLWILLDLVGTLITAAGFYKLVMHDTDFLPGATPLLLFVVGGTLIVLAIFGIVSARIARHKNR